MNKNIFSSLNQSTSSQNENFLTEGFVYLLNLLVERKAPSINGLLTNIFGEDCRSWFANLDDITIVTQLTINEGRPDIVLKVG